ncbi:tripartite tricarboxylate transporter substrate-binding protein [Cupriavidus necator]
MKIRWILGAAVCMTAACVSAQESYPSRPIRMVVAFTAGSSTDLMARIVANQMSINLKRPVIVENRPGAGGAIAAGYVAKAPADGYTVLAHSGSYVIAPWLYKSLPYDPQRDLISVAAFGGFPGVVLAPAGKYKSLSDLIAVARKTNGGLNFASAGTGSSTHMSAEKINMLAKISGQHIPFRGTPEAITDVAAGRSQYFVSPINTAMGMVKEGRVNAVAITSKRRSPLLPNVPTIAEAGLPGAEYPLWVGAFVSAKTPPAIVARLHQEIARAIDSTDVKRQYAANGIEDLSMPQAKFERFIRDEIVLSGELAKRANVQPE